MPPTVSTELARGTDVLSKGNVIRPKRHTELLLQKVLSVGRVDLYLNAKRSLNQSQLDEFDSLLERRLNGVPIQYLVGWTYFWGYQFKVGEGVFIPRFDSEVIIERVLSLCGEESFRDRQLHTLDLCCGCGVLGLTIAKEAVHSEVTLIDNSDIALRWAEINKHEMNLPNAKILKLDVMKPFPKEFYKGFDIIVANPPYIPIDEISTLHPDVKLGEPMEALTDNGDGLSFYRKWTDTIPPIITDKGVFITEISDTMEQSVSEIFSSAFASLLVHNDLSGLARAIEVRKIATLE